jgi:predicted transcriptional regulator
VSIYNSPKLRVRDVMTTRLITVKENQTRQQAARLLAQNRISGLPVINDEGVAIGVVSEIDIIGKEGQTIGDIMTRSVISVTPETELEEVSRILVHERIKGVLVVEQGKLVGVVSRADLVKEVATRWVCHVCGEITHSEEEPERCPRCHAAEVVAYAEAAAPGS